MGKKVLVIGSGGREHALLWKLAQSPEVEKLYAAPGSDVIGQLAEVVGVSSFSALANFAKRAAIDFTVVGPDNPLAEGIVDTFQKYRLLVFGPTRNAAIIEWQKGFAKQFMVRHRIPTAPFAVFTKQYLANRYLTTASYPLMVKNSRLAKGKGVFECATASAAEQALRHVISESNGKQWEVVFEGKLVGEELSGHTLADRSTFQVFPYAQDYKHLLDDRRGPLTGSMGAIAPVSVGKNLRAQIESRIVGAALQGMIQERRVFRGCLYPGLMLTSRGPMVLEYNARFGDPEAQVYMRLLKTDLLRALLAVAEDCLVEVPLEWESDYAVCVVLASSGYPHHPQIGFPISGIAEAEAIPGVVIFHAGTRRQDEQWLTDGGRVLNVTATGSSLAEARERAYRAVRRIRFKGMQYRKDIGLTSLAISA